MAYPERFDPPDLPADASTLRNQLELGMAFHARQVPPSPRTVRLLTTYMITTDKAACRRVRDHMTSGGGIQSFVEGVGHFENCINATKRALRVLGRLGTQPDGPAIDRTIRKLAQSQDRTITDLRDAIEHMDDIVLGSGIPDGAPHLLPINKEETTLRLELITYQLWVYKAWCAHFTLRALQSFSRCLHPLMPNPSFERTRSTQTSRAHITTLAVHR